MGAEIIYGELGIMICLGVILIDQVIKFRRECKITRQLLNRTNFKDNG